MTVPTTQTAADGIGDAATLTAVFTAVSIGAGLAGYGLAKVLIAVNERQQQRAGAGSQVDDATVNTRPANSGWTPREPNNGGFATDKRSRGRIGGVRRER